MTAHWGIEDPAAVEGTALEKERAFVLAHRYLRNRILIFNALPIKSLDRLALSAKLREIGETEGRVHRREGSRMSAAIDIIIYHNPACGTSRNTLGLIRNCGAEPRIVEYLKTPPSRAELVSLIDRMGISARDLLRKKGTPYDELKLDDPALSDDQLIDAMMAHPILINRPIVVTPNGVKLCRPSEAVLDILPLPQKGEFRKEDGELVVNAAGQRVVAA